MLLKLSQRLANRLFNHGAISEELKDVYVYGFQLLISFVFSTSLVLFIGVALSKLIETLMFLIVYILLRSFSGGYHSKTYFMCTIITICVYLIVVLFTSFLDVNLIAYLSLLFIGTVLLLLLAPVKHPNKIITARNVIKYKAISIVLFIIFISIGIYFIAFDIRLSNVVFYTLCADIVNLFPNCRSAIKINRRRRKE